MFKLIAHHNKHIAIFYNIMLTFSLFSIFYVFTACSSTNDSLAEENLVSLEKIPWCNNQQATVFMDDSAPTTKSTALERTNMDTLGPATGTPVALKDWNTLKGHLGFSVFLPTGLPAGSCLLSASGSVRNAVSGSNFTLTYLLTDQTSLAITQALQRAKQTPFQCSAMPTISSSGSVFSPQGDGTPMAGTQLCTGTHGTTHIAFSVNWNKQMLWQFFQELQPHENWMPHA
jgi:hypothetical protein